MMTNRFLKLAGILLILLIFSCQKTENSARNEQRETSLEQKPEILKSETGDSIRIIYFAKNDEVAMILKINGEEQTLTAKGTNSRGEPIFNNEEFAWEMMEDGHSGRLTDKSGKTVVYK
ncbi:MAG: hypothetical protein LBE36_00360 [Flavobacteriaceae bacterium]|jgi:hypothetical protein|nr:hypothetical protein [Flavobacteriaceae bacterium]